MKRADLNLWLATTVGWRFTGGGLNGFGNMVGTEQSQTEPGWSTTMLVELAIWLQMRLNLGLAMLGLVMVKGLAMWEG
jgi:hypothetical protein